MLVFVDPPEKLHQTCPTCPLLLSPESQQAVDAARVTLASYKRQSTLGAGLGVKKITRASAQVHDQIVNFDWTNEAPWADLNVIFIGKLHLRSLGVHEHTSQCTFVASVCQMNAVAAPQ